MPKTCCPLIAVIALALLPASAPASTQEFQIIVHPTVQGTKITRTNLSALFMGKTARWGNNAQARPVEQSARAPVRRAFTTAVLGLSMGELWQYWERRVIKEHVFPPPTVSSDEEVLGYVASHEGAIGYVAAATAIPATVKVIAVVD